MKKYFTLRTQLIPYLYTYAWLAHRESLQYAAAVPQVPQLEEAYRHSHEYFFGDEMLVAPVSIRAAIRPSIFHGVSGSISSTAGATRGAALHRALRRG